MLTAERISGKDIGALKAWYTLVYPYISNACRLFFQQAATSRLPTACKALRQMGCLSCTVQCAARRCLDFVLLTLQQGSLTNTHDT